MAFTFTNLTQVYVKRENAENACIYKIPHTRVMKAIFDLLKENPLESFSLGFIHKHLVENMLPLLSDLKTLEIFDHEVSDDPENIMLHEDPSLCLMNKILAENPPKLRKLWLSSNIKRSLYFPLLSEIALSNYCKALEYIVLSTQWDDYQVTLLTLNHSKIFKTSNL